MPSVLLLLLFITGVIVLVAVTANRSPAPCAERFAQRHRLALTPEGAAAVAGYLATTRRHQARGALAGGALWLLWHLQEGRIDVDVTAMLAGWLVGGAVAEFALGRPARQFPAEPGLLPRWLPAVPACLTGLAVAVTPLYLVAMPETAGAASAARWGVLAVLAAGLVALVLRHLARREVLPGAPLDVDRATRLHAAASVASVGLLVSSQCLVRPLPHLYEGLEAVTLTAVRGTSVAWLVGSFVLAYAVWSAAASGGRARIPAVIGAGLVVASVLWIGAGVLRDRPPYGPTDVVATAHLRLATAETFAAEAAAFGVPWANGAVIAGQQPFLGRVEVTAPSGAPRDSWYYVVVIDTRTDTAVQIWAENGAGWNGFLDRLPDRYPWLSAVRSRPSAHVLGHGDVLSVDGRPGAPGPILFHGTVADPSRLKRSDLLVALIFTGPEQQIYWAVQVPITMS
ncbi:hypothetical protein CS0771_19580 [Catellatospora sp. IY07-71]|uniref:hypothetical protein n=1 Tax=Catellatospora sp. IY07-71 TaxID=2728827 RepID=UPI001BB40271|nr:hypothetical protein [Catellatospora sp. IY07-71]BCJ72414.1 hypothetical protein CS0771_19580 [Catellatospora sp. IY07-71]